MGEKDKRFHNLEGLGLRGWVLGCPQDNRAYWIKDCGSRLGPYVGWVLNHRTGLHTCTIQYSKHRHHSAVCTSNQSFTLLPLQ